MVALGSDREHRMAVRFSATIAVVMVVALAAAGLLLGPLPNAAVAAPLRCSDEHRACVAVCSKLGDGRALRLCITSCAQKRAVCQRTGCWNNGTTGYCGLSRQ